MKVIKKKEEITSQKPRSSEIHPGPGFRIIREIERSPKELIDKFRVFNAGYFGFNESSLYHGSCDKEHDQQ